MAIETTATENIRSSTMLLFAFYKNILDKIRLVIQVLLS
jgi:hypothetical protein